ncbi:MAG: hypothetical protein U0931_05725 [Vulcanimicrobiota bacterium]
MSIISHSIAQLRARTPISVEKLPNGVNKAQLDEDLARYDLPTLGNSTPRQIFVQDRGWRTPQLKAADAAGQEMSISTRLSGFHRVYVVTDASGSTTVYDPKENSLHFASPVNQANCESIAGGMAHFRSWRRDTTQSLTADGTLTVKADQQVERDTFRGGQVGYQESCLLATLPPGQPLRVRNFTEGLVEEDHRAGQGRLQGDELRLTDADQKSHKVQLYLEPPR